MSDSLQAHCVLWQERLRLRDWEVAVTTVQPGTLGNPNIKGTITWQLHSRSARISVVESADMAANDPEYDQERTLVHELLHLHFLAWDTASGTPEDTALEQAIWAISRALVVAYRT